MPRDRFSRFKKSNYNNDFRYGINSMNHVGVGEREKLNTEQRDWVINLIKNEKTTEWDKKFLKSVLADNKVPTKKQKDVIVKINNKTKKL
jgi:hypothetical protein